MNNNFFIIIINKFKNTIITIEEKPSFFKKIKKYNSKYSYKKYNHLCYKYNYYIKIIIIYIINILQSCKSLVF
jgi:hypothetical protein